MTTRRKFAIPAVLGILALLTLAAVQWLPGSGTLSTKDHPTMQSSVRPSDISETGLKIEGEKGQESDDLPTILDPVDVMGGEKNPPHQPDATSQPNEPPADNQPDHKGGPDGSSSGAGNDAGGNANVPPRRPGSSSQPSDFYGVPDAAKLGGTAYNKLTNHQKRMLARSDWPVQYAEDFNGKSLGSQWKHCYPWGDCFQASHEYEEQWYQPNNVWVSNGHLNIQSRRQSKTHKGRYFGFTSGLVHLESRPITNGRVDVRAKTAAGRALWPAIWLLPTTRKSRPEIDIMEQYFDTNHQEHTFHPVSGNRSQFHTHNLDASGGFHTFSAQWDNNNVIYMVDGKVVGSVSNANINSPMYLLMNMAVGNQYWGKSNHSTPDRATFLIDSVRISSQ